MIAAGLLKDYLNLFFFIKMHTCICARFKQKRPLGCICDFEIHAYLGSGVKKNSSEKKLEHEMHFFDSFFLVFSLYIYCMKECDWEL